jgi:hypothetical protein
MYLSYAMYRLCEFFWHLDNYPPRCTPLPETRNFNKIVTFLERLCFDPQDFDVKLGHTFGKGEILSDTARNTLQEMTKIYHK